MHSAASAGSLGGARRSHVDLPDLVLDLGGPASDPRSARRLVHGVLRAALSDAERLDLVSRNVAKAARPPSLGRTERRALTADEARALLEP